jgi:hypothetical protein
MAMSHVGIKRVSRILSNVPRVIERFVSIQLAVAHLANFCLYVLPIFATSASLKTWRCSSA